MPKPACVEVRGWHQVSSFVSLLYKLLLETGPLTKPGAHYFWLVLSFPSVLGPWILCTGNVNPGPHVCTPGILLSFFQSCKACLPPPQIKIMASEVTNECGAVWNITIFCQHGGTLTQLWNIPLPFTGKTVWLGLGEHKLLPDPSLTESIEPQFMTQVRK